MLIWLLLAIQGIIQRLTVIIKSANTGDALERFVFEIGYMNLSKFKTESAKDQASVINDLHLLIGLFIIFVDVGLYLCF